MAVVREFYCDIQTGCEQYCESIQATKPSSDKLERLLDRPPHVGPPSYDLPLPRNVMEAVEQGNLVAEQERRRLSLGHNPIPDMSDLINSQNIWASGAELPEDMSGLFLNHSSIGLCILVNFGVSYQAALFRLKSLSIVNEAEFTELRDREQFGRQYLELLRKCQLAPKRYH
jgi:hypothetical protein